MIDKNFCSSSYLMYRYVYDSSKDFGLPIKRVDLSFNRAPINTSDELIDFLRAKVEDATKDGKAALALSGGIDSAILARLLPKTGGGGGVHFSLSCSQQKSFRRICAGKSLR